MVNNSIMKYVGLYVVGTCIFIIVLTAYFAKRNFVVCRALGGVLVSSGEKCECASQPCIATTCGHTNKCVWKK